MHKLLFAFIGLSFALLLRANGENYVTGELLVQLTPEFENPILSKELIEKYKVTVLEEVSNPMKVWRLKFDHTLIEHELIKRKLAELPSIGIAQNNHYIEDRAVPNDPIFGDQWQHDKIMSELAWDVSTGGTTILGDRIVVCIIEDLNYNHEDLFDNRWVNAGEIPNNNIDDDGNGYVDDYNGWNPVNNTDDVLPIVGDDHGTSVAGMIGAVGNNSLGIAGINWDVELMTVTRGSLGAVSSPNEANVIAAYTYPYTMRKLYNETGGTKGAFVVATNASWGLDNGQPANAPIWCSFYDSLGAVGILNCGATSNDDLNVDVTGDLPTACGSDFMISVSSTDIDDTIRGGYGATTIDLGAPGAGIFTTTDNGANYGYTSGTSFASPLTAGVIALLYSAPCATLIEKAYIDPEGAARDVRNALLDGCDPVSFLNGMVVTGGRLNASNSMNIIANGDCSSGDCAGVFGIEADSLTDTSLHLSWDALSIPNYFIIQTNENGTGWQSIDSLFAYSTSLTGLNICADYEIRIVSICDTISDTSSIYSVRTDGCCEAPESFAIDSIDHGSIFLSWNPVLASIGYSVIYSVEGSGIWDSIPLSDTTLTYEIDGLLNCTDYLTLLKLECDDGDFDYSDTLLVTSLGCGACFDFEYCQSNGVNSSEEYLNQIIVGDLNVQTGNNDGYFEQIDNEVEYTIGASYDFYLEPFFPLSSFDEVYTIRIDLNQNGSFESDELLIESTAIDTPFYGQIDIPLTALPGVTKMRISMCFEDAAGACQSFAYGEVEDYCITLIEDTNTCDIPEIILNENDGIFTATVQNDVASSYDFEYRISGGSWVSENSTDSVFQFPLDMSCTEYEIRAKAHCDSLESEYSAIHTVMTGNCGNCLDLDYCEEFNWFSTNLWIDSISIDGQVSGTGNNDGYLYADQTMAVRADWPNHLKVSLGNVNSMVKFQMWIDQDMSGDFGAGEIVVDTLTDQSVLNSEFMVANVSGETRLRARVSNQVNFEAVCFDNGVGEIEDYCTDIFTSLKSEDELWAVFPNPNFGMFHVAGIQETVELRVYNSIGKLLLIKTLNHSESISHELVKGVYIYEIIGARGKQVGKMIIE